MLFLFWNIREIRVIILIKYFENFCNWLIWQICWKIWTLIEKSSNEIQSQEMLLRSKNNIFYTRYAFKFNPNLMWSKYKFLIKKINCYTLSYSWLYGIWLPLLLRFVSASLRLFGSALLVRRKSRIAENARLQLVFFRRLG